jgi:uncharacterized membrane protein YkoI
MMKKIVAVTCTLLAAGITAGTLSAANAASNVHKNDEVIDANALSAAKLSAQDAIGAAAQTVTGQVAELKLHTKDGAALYQVTIVSSDGNEHDLQVNATTGKVTAIVANDDHKDDQGEGEGEGGDGDGDGEEND